MPSILTSWFRTNKDPQSGVGVPLGPHTTMDCNELEDNFTEVRVRKMTYAEVARTLDGTPAAKKNDIVAFVDSTNQAPAKQTKLPASPAKMPKRASERVEINAEFDGDSFYMSRREKKRASRRGKRH